MIAIVVDDALAERCRAANMAVDDAKAAMQIATPYQVNNALGAIIKAKNEQTALGLELMALVGTGELISQMGKLPPRDAGK